MSKKNSLAIIFFVLSSTCFISWYKIDDPDAQDKERQCMVLDKLQTYGSDDNEGKFILILSELSTLKKFDLAVTPTTYSTASLGEVLTFKLTNREMGRYDHDSLISLGQGLLLICGIILLVLFFFVITNL